MRLLDFNLHFRPLTSSFRIMEEKQSFEVIIIGGSYAGLSAGLALGRAMRKVLIIDGGKPCNRYTPHSHNFITHDGEEPAVIAEKAKAQVQAYPTVHFNEDLAVKASKQESHFEIECASGDIFRAKRLLFATGVKDPMPDIPGFANCWGKSIIHCPYCHGYEVKHAKTGILAAGDVAMHYAQLISNWTADLSIYSNGPSGLKPDQLALLDKHQIPVIEKEIAAFDEEKGQLKHILFKDGSNQSIEAIYSKPSFEQHCPLPASLACQLNEQGLLEVDFMQRTTQPHIYACGDSASPFRAVSYAVASGSIAGAVINNDLIEETFSRI